MHLLATFLLALTALLGLIATSAAVDFDTSPNNNLTNSVNGPISHYYTSGISSLNATKGYLDFPNRAADDGCVNSQCWEYYADCTNGPPVVPESVLQDVIGAFCADKVGLSIEHGTSMQETYNQDGFSVLLYVESSAPSGSWLMDPDLCHWGFGDVLVGCEANGPASGTRGGYIFLHYKCLSFWIAVNGALTDNLWSC